MRTVVIKYKWINQVISNGTKNTGRDEIASRNVFVLFLVHRR